MTGLTVIAAFSLYIIVHSNEHNYWQCSTDFIAANRNWS